MDIFTEILTEPYFKDRDNIQSLLRNLSSQYQGDLIDNSVSYARFLANRTISESQFISDMNFSTQFLLNLSSKFTASEADAQHFYVDDLNYQMTTLMNYLLKAHRMEFLVHTNEVE
jgi:Zn-dependent M16 (insulinase) family peptidase